MQQILGVTIQHNANTIYQQKSTSHKIHIKSKVSAIERREAHLARPIAAVDVACEALTCLGGGNEVHLGYLGILVVTLGAPLGGAAHLLDLALAVHLDVVRVETVKPRDLLVKHVLRRLRYR
jgi:hypothetical protein